MQRAQGWTKKKDGHTSNPPAEIETTEDLGDLCDEVVEELRNADGSALELETHLLWHDPDLI